MARKSRDEDLLLEDELTAAFLGEEDNSNMAAVPADDDMGMGDEPLQDQPQDDWEEDEAVPGQLAVDVYETKERLVVKARTAGFPARLPRARGWQAARWPPQRKSPLRQIASGSAGSGPHAPTRDAGLRSPIRGRAWQAAATRRSADAAVLAR